MWMVPYLLWTCLAGSLFWLSVKFTKDLPMAVIIIYVIGILAIFNYNEYTEKRKFVAAAIEHSTVLKAAVAQQLQAGNAVTLTPPSQGTNLANVGSVTVGNKGKIIIVLENADESLQGKSIVFIPRLKEGLVTWDCRSMDISDTLLPDDCMHTE